MSIWILAIVTLTLLALAGWRQGGILAAFSFVGIILGYFLAAPLGHLARPVVSIFGVSDPLIAWALAPIVGFMVVVILVSSAGIKVNREVNVFFKHKAGELRNAMWERMNLRLGICVGLLNGAAYFVLACFAFFNLSYLVGQVAVADNQPFMVRIVSNLGKDMESSGLTRVATSVGKLPPLYYQISDLTGFLMQNPATGARLATYPGLTSLWERDDMQPLVMDAALTNALASGTSLGEVLKDPSVQDFFKNKDLRERVMSLMETNGDDLMTYLKTGESGIYRDKLIGNWAFNVRVTLAWWRLSQPKVDASEMLLIRNLWTKAYASTTVLATGDHQLFIKQLPVFKGQAKGGTDVETQDWKGDWSVDDGTNYTLHVSLNGDDKFLSATADDLRLSAKDGKSQLFFDRVD